MCVVCLVCLVCVCVRCVAYAISDSHTHTHTQTHTHTHTFPSTVSIPIYLSMWYLVCLGGRTNGGAERHSALLCLLSFILKTAKTPHLSQLPVPVLHPSSTTCTSTTPMDTVIHTNTHRNTCICMHACLCVCMNVCVCVCVCVHVTHISVQERGKMRPPSRSFTRTLSSIKPTT